MSSVLSRSLLSRVCRNHGLLTTTRNQIRLQLRCYASYPEHQIIGMPALSPTMVQGNLAVWVKKEGDSLSPGDVIAEVETDKAQMDFEFQDEGYLAKILVPEGTKDVPVNKPIAVYVENEGDVSAFKDFKLEESQGQTPKVEEKVEEEVKEVKPVSAKVVEDNGSRTRIIASPLAKMIALEQGIALKNVTGTGPHGRIVKSDIDQYLKENEAKTTPVVSPAAPQPVGGGGGATATGTTMAVPGDNFIDIEVSQMRKIIADRLLQSTQSIPSYIVSSRISVSKLMKLRQSLNSRSHGEYKLSINDILMKAIGVASRRVPEANSHWLGDRGVIRQYKNVDISVAVATPSGLLTPIIKNVESKGLTSISREVKELASRAKINKLKPEEFQGGTICISNMGMNDAVSMFTSIINPPQSTILAVGTIERVAVEDVGSDVGFTFDNQMCITGTFDHRTIDGARAGEFMKALKSVIENPLELLL